MLAMARLHHPCPARYRLPGFPGQTALPRSPGPGRGLLCEKPACILGKGAMRVDRGLDFPTRSSDVDGVPDALLSGVREVLGEQFYGMYLQGSRGLGDFDPDSSDIDFVVVTDVVTDVRRYNPAGPAPARVRRRVPGRGARRSLGHRRLRLAETWRGAGGVRPPPAHRSHSDRRTPTGRVRTRSLLVSTDRGPPPAAVRCNMSSLCCKGYRIPSGTLCPKRATSSGTGVRIAGRVVREALRPHRLPVDRTPTHPNPNNCLLPANIRAIIPVYRAGGGAPWRN